MQNVRHELLGHVCERFGAFTIPRHRLETNCRPACYCGRMLAADMGGAVMSHYDEQRSHTDMLKDRIKALELTTNAAMSVSGHIKKAAFELGYQESMGCTELDYIIELARATVMVNDRNLELVHRYEHLMENDK